MSPDRKSTMLPPLPARRSRRNWGQLLARIVAVALALVGLLPFALGFVARSSAACGWVAQKTTRSIRDQGIFASYGVSMSLWPLALELHRMRVESTDDTVPLIQAARIVVRPRLFPLLSGKLVVEEVDVEAPSIRLVVRKGKLVNSPIELPESKTSTEPFHAPFALLSVSDASIDVDIDGTRAKAHDIDLDVTAEDDPLRGSSFEIALAVEQADVRRPELSFDGVGGGAPTAFDDDTLCKVEARVRVEPSAVVVHRLSAVGSFDLDPAADSTPPCDLPTTDERRLEVALAHVRVELPTKTRPMPTIRGHAHLRTPVALGARLAKLPEVEGWIAVDADVRYAEDTIIPELTGHLEGHGIRLDQYRFAALLESDVFVQKNVVRSPRTRVVLADGEVLLRDTVVSPLEKGVPLQTRLDAKNISFAGLMRDLGVSAKPHVTWDIEALHVATFVGTIDPLQLDGDLQIQTANFGVFDKYVGDPTRARLIGFREASVVGKVAVRPEALEFRQIRAVLPGSIIEGGFCSIGFHNDLRVDVPSAHVDIADITPIGSVRMQGLGDLNVHVAGKFDDPYLKAEGRVSEFVLGEIPFGTVSHLRAAFSGEVVELTELAVTKGTSGYSVPAARLDFGVSHGVVVDALASSQAFGLRDLLAIFHLEEDPRFAEFDARLAQTSTVHVALGGPEDRCGEGYVEVHSEGELRDVRAFGERFEEGSMKLDLRWFDREAGIAGAEIDVPSALLRKRKPRGDDGRGTVFGSAHIRRGGDMTASLAIDAIPLSRVDLLGGRAAQLDGSLSGFARVLGNVDGFRVESQVDVTPTRVQGVAFGASRFDVDMVQYPSAGRSNRVSGCHAPVPPAFDAAAYERNTEPTGEFVVRGRLLDGQVVVDRLVMMRQKSPSLIGTLSFDKLDLGPFTELWGGEGRDPLAEPQARQATRGELSGALSILELRLDDLPHASVRFVPKSLSMERSGQRIALRPTPAAVKYSHDVLSLPGLVFDLTTAGGLRGSLTLDGKAIHVSEAPELDVDVGLTPLDLSGLPAIVKKVDRAAGVLDGRVHLSGKLAAPEASGELNVRGGELSVKGLPSELSEIELSVTISAQAVRLARSSARFAGGTVRATGVLPLRGFHLGVAEAVVDVRDVRLVPAEGATASLDALLWLTADGKSLPHVRGEVSINAFNYTRPINLVTDLTGFRVGAARTEVESYDPALDALSLDLRIVARSPLTIRNNLVELGLAIGQEGLVVSGTNQRFGVRGELHSQPGGRFHFRSTDFDIRQASLRFDDPTRIEPKIDVVATTEYRRYTDSSLSAGAAGGAGAGAGGTGAVHAGGLWRITLHAHGESKDAMRVELLSDPALSQDDIVLLLAIGMTRAEIYQLQAGSVTASFALEALATASGSDRALREALPVIDDFRFGSSYSTRVGRTIPQLTVGKRVSETVRANVTKGLAEDGDLRSNIEWRLGQGVSVQGSYDNVNNVSSPGLGNVGVDFRWRLEFE